MSEINNPVTAEQADTLGLAFADIENAVKIIDYAADQGAFRGWSTIEQVFGVRARLNQFVEAARTSAETDESAPAAE